MATRRERRKKRREGLDATGLIELQTALTGAGLTDAQARRFMRGANLRGGPADFDLAKTVTKGTKADIAEQEAQEVEQQQAVEDVQSQIGALPEFAYDPNQQFLTDLNRITQQQAAQAGRLTGQGLASRGVANSGQLARAQREIQGALGGQMAQNRLQDFQRQFGTFQTNRQNKFGDLMTSFNIGQGERDRLSQDFFNNLALQQQQANRNYQQRQNRNQNIWGGIGQGLSIGSQFIPGT